MKNKKGFTLFELTIALAIITILSGGMFLVFRSPPHHDLENASLQLQADIRYAQRRAIIEGRRVEVEIFRYHYDVRLIRPEIGNKVIRTVYFPDGIYLDRRRVSFRVGYLPSGRVDNSDSFSLNSGRDFQYLTIVPSGGRVYRLQVNETPPRR